jgi:hypothetical protein
MPLDARAFLGIWHNLKPGAERDFDRWHTYEHMHERIGVPGFRQARRYMNRELASHVCFTMYEAAHLETFRSPGYLARLNDPTPWSRRVGATQTDFLRGAFEIGASLGDGVGGAMSTFRLALAPAGRERSLPALRRAAQDVHELHGVVGVHVGSARQEVTGVRTREMEIRPSTSAENAVDSVVLVETIGFEELEAVLAEIESRAVASSGEAVRDPAGDSPKISGSGVAMLTRGRGRDLRGERDGGPIEQRAQAGGEHRRLPRLVSH